MPQLRYMMFDGTRQIHEVKPGLTRIGRTPDNDLQIDELAVSSHHCLLHYHNGVLSVKDLDSVSGTYVEGQLVQEAEVKAGQVLSLGTFLVSVEDSGTAGNATPPELRPVALPDGSYSCLRHPNKRAQFECPECFALACEQCVTLNPASAAPIKAVCRACGGTANQIDWSGLTMTKKQAALSLLPSPVKLALKFWEEHQRKEKK